MRLISAIDFSLLSFKDVFCESYEQVVHHVQHTLAESDVLYMHNRKTFSIAITRL